MLPVASSSKFQSVNTGTLPTVSPANPHTNRAAVSAGVGAQHRRPETAGQGTAREQSGHGSDSMATQAAIAERDSSASTDNATAHSLAGQFFLQIAHGNVQFHRVTEVGDIVHTQGAAGLWGRKTRIPCIHPLRSRCVAATRTEAPALCETDSLVGHSTCLQTVPAGRRRSNRELCMPRQPDKAESG